MSGTNVASKRGREALIGLSVLSVLAVVFLLVRSQGAEPPAQTPTPAPAAPAAIQPAAAPAAGAFVYRIPKPGDPEYADYQEMLQQPEYRSSVENSPGYAMPYDPEWRSVVTGRREAPVVDLPFVGGEPSLDDLARMLVIAVGEKDRDMLDHLRLNFDEFSRILWPEFPQSRPFLRIPVEEAWQFHVTKLHKGMDHLIGSHGGKHLSVETVEGGTVVRYRNFTLYQNPRITVRNADTGEVLTLEEVEAVAEREGRFKVYIYGS